MAAPFTKAGDAELRFGHQEPWDGDIQKREDSEGIRKGPSPKRQGQAQRSETGSVGLVAPMCWNPPCPYLLPLHPRKTGGSIGSRLSLRALENISDNQLITSLIRIKHEPFLEKEARAGRTQWVRPVGPGALCWSRVECLSLAPAWPLLAVYPWTSVLHSLGCIFPSEGEQEVESD